MKKIFRLKSLVLILVVSLVLILLALKFLFSHNKASPYLTTIAKKGDIELSVLANAIVKPQNLVAIGAQTSGKIVSLTVKPGGKVVKNQIIAHIDSTNQTNDLQRAQHALTIYQAKLKEAKLQLALSQAKLDRSRKLLAANALMSSVYKETETQLKVDEAELEALKAQIAQAQIDVKTANAALSYTEIKSPSSGTILATLVQEGQNINAVQSVPVVAILGNLQRMKIYAQISEADIKKINLGQQVYFDIEGDSSRRYYAKLETIDPAPETIRNDIMFNSSVNTQTSSGPIYYNATFSVDNSDNYLFTYMHGEAHIVFGKAKNVIVIPSAALQNIHDNTAQIEVKHGSTIEQRQIIIGLNDRLMVEVKSGLNAGEEVILPNVEAASTALAE